MSTCLPLIRASHVIELRAAINTFRAAVGLAPATFTDPALSPGASIKAVHLTDLRAALAPALAAISAAAPSYTDATITQGVTSVKAMHYVELQDLVR